MKGDYSLVRNYILKIGNVEFCLRDLIVKLFDKDKTKSSAVSSMIVYLLKTGQIKAIGKQKNVDNRLVMFYKLRRY